MTDNAVGARRRCWILSDTPDLMQFAPWGPSWALRARAASLTTDKPHPLNLSEERTELS
jgi:lipopolysaccharide export system protein LptC